MVSSKVSGLDVPSAEPGHPTDAAATSPGFEELAAMLEAITTRAEAHGWPGWSEMDARVLEAAAREIRAIPEALARGMNEAFSIGREYGHGEEALDELNREIAELSSSLARQAWGGHRAGWA
jgi:hypothetical protein